MRLQSCSGLVLIAVVGGCSSRPLEPSAEGESANVPTDSEDLAPRSDPVPAQYPEGPFGTKVGATIENLSFLGWRDGARVGFDPSQLEVVRLSDYYNPDGSGKVRLLALNVSAVWCTVCRAEYGFLERDQIHATFQPKGVELLGVLFQDAMSQPARPEDLVIWGGPNGFRVPFPLVIDPGFKTRAYFTSDATPMNMLIDTTNMRVLDIVMGYDIREPKSYWAKIDRWLAQ